MNTLNTPEKKPAVAGVEAVAEWLRVRARNAFQSAQQYPEGCYERRFIEHGAMCYFNCLERLMAEFPTASKPPPSATPAER